VNGPGIVVAMVSEAKTLTKAPWAPGELIHLPGGGILNIAGIGARRAEGAARALLASGVTGLVSWGLQAASRTLPRSLVPFRQHPPAGSSLMRIGPNMAPQALDPIGGKCRSSWGDIGREPQGPHDPSGQGVVLFPHRSRGCRYGEWSHRGCGFGREDPFYRIRAIQMLTRSSHFVF
jgi:hypothetical protein